MNPRLPNSASQGDEPDRLPTHDEILPFDPDEFATALQWALNAASRKASIQDPRELATGYIDEDGEQIELHFADTPTTRMIVAVRERYRDVSRLKFLSALVRIFALFDLLRAGSLEPWVRPSTSEPDATEIHDAVVEAAAVAPLDERLEFPVKVFVNMVKQIQAGMAS